MEIRYKGLILVNDNDKKKFLKQVMSNLSIDLSAEGNSGQFLLSIKNNSFDFVIIDFAAGTTTEIFDIILTIRELFGSEIPIFTIGVNKQRTELAHSIEIGANNCFIEPFDLLIISTKLSHYLSSPEIFDRQLKYRRVPGDGASVFMYFNIEIMEISEFGVSVSSPHLLAKSTILEIDFSELDLMVKTKVRVTSNWIAPDRKSFGAYLEFDNDNKELLRTVRHYIQDEI